MAALLRGSSSPESSKPNSRQRHSHERQSIDTGRRHDSRSRRPQCERGRDISARRSPPRQLHRPIQPQLPTPLATPGSSTPSLPSPVEHARGFEMERTPSGHSIISDNTFEPQHNNTLTYRDEEAARMVEFHFRRRLTPHGKHERILRNIIERRDPLDNDALDGIITSADSVFFDGALRGRVRWEWSSQERYMTDLIGTTALRPAVHGGFETLIVLSEPILTHPDYDRRLLLSAFLHELVHCYLFIRCGFDARVKGGHTPGFHHIAGIIDKWVGGSYLRLCSMKANLNHFRKDRSNPVADPRVEAFRGDRHSHEGCNQSPMPERDFLEDTGVTGDWR